MHMHTHTHKVHIPHRVWLVCALPQVMTCTCTCTASPIIIAAAATCCCAIAAAPESVCILLWAIVRFYRLPHAPLRRIRDIGTDSDRDARTHARPPARTYARTHAHGRFALSQIGSSTPACRGRLRDDAIGRRGTSIVDLPPPPYLYVAAAKAGGAARAAHSSHFSPPGGRGRRNRLPVRCPVARTSALASPFIISISSSPAVLVIYWCVPGALPPAGPRLRLL